MATQSIRNIMNNSIARIIPEIKKRVREEGQKKLEELQQELLSPEAIVLYLQPEINKDTCSERGKKIFQERVDKLEEDINSIEEQLLQGISSLEVLANKIGPITTTAVLPSNVPSPTKTINGISELLEPLTSSLNIVIKAAPAILAASSGPAANGKVIAGTNNNVNKAKSLIKEFINLFKTIPRQIKHYQRKANKLYAMINNLQEQIQKVIDKIGLLKSFIIFLEMDFLNKCGNLEDPSPPIDLTTGETIPPQMTMEDLIAQIESLYGDVLDSLVAQGDTKAIERTFTINEKFERIKNTRIRTVKI